MWGGGGGRRGEKGEEKIEPHFQIFATVQFLSTNREILSHEQCFQCALIGIDKGGGGGGGGGRVPNSQLTKKCIPCKRSLS